MSKTKDNYDVANGDKLDVANVDERHLTSTHEALLSQWWSKGSEGVKCMV